MSNFISAIEVGIDSSLAKESSRKEIFDVIAELSDEISNWNEDLKVIYKTKEQVKIENTPIMNIIMSNNKFIGTIEPEESAILDYVLFVINNKGEQAKLTDLALSPKGYPCSIMVDGNMLKAYDKEVFFNNIKKLLESASAGDAFRKVLKR